MNYSYIYMNECLGYFVIFFNIISCVILKVMVYCQVLGYVDNNWMFLLIKISYCNNNNLI